MIFFLCLAAASVAAALMYSRWAMPALRGAVPWSKQTDQFRILLRMPRYVGLYGGGLLVLAAVAAWRVPPDRWRMAWWIPSILVLGALVRLATPNMAMNTAPDPDGIHYALTAVQLVSHGSFLIPFGKDLLPSRMPPGPSLIMCLSQWLDPGEPGWGIYAVGLFSVLTLWLTYHIGVRLFGRRAGAVAAGLLAVSPIHIHYTRQLMGEVPWTLFVLAGLYLVAEPRRRFWTAALGGALMGVAVLFKPPHLFILAGTGAVLGLFVLRQPRQWLNRGLVFLGMAGLLALSWPLYNRLVFGDWLLTGYRVFSPEYYGEVHPAFGWSYLWRRPLVGGSLGNLPYYVLVFFGLDPRPERMVWPAPAALLFCAAFARRRNKAFPPSARAFLLTASGAALAYSAVMLFYSFQDPRFFLPFAPLLFLYAGARLDPLLERTPAILKRLAALLVVVVLAAATLAGCHAERVGSRADERDLWRKVAAAVEGYDVLVTDAEPALLTFRGVWTPPRRIIPLMPPGAYWLTADPGASFRATKKAAGPHPGTIRATREALAAGLNVAVWLRVRHYEPAVYDEFMETFEVVEKPETGVPHFGAVTGLRAASSPPP